jgi:hypothetical protein
LEEISARDHAVILRHAVGESMRELS